MVDLRPRPLTNRLRTPRCEQTLTWKGGEENPMIKRKIGESRPLNAIGLGCIGISFA
jgi:hypothetical protein